jgi:hypothetical protein
VIEGNAMTLSGAIHDDGVARYQLDLHLKLGVPMTYKELVKTLEDMDADISDVFLLRTDYKRDAKGELVYAENGRMVENGHRIDNNFVACFEREWGNAQSE